jgi:tRNA(Ile)-lysidine synthase
VGADVCPAGSNLAEAVAASLQRHQQFSRHLVVAYSGGLDSTVLLHLLNDLRQRHLFNLSALHVHHGLSPNADAWATHCASICAGLNIPLHIERVQVDARGQGVEAAARHARYRVFADVGAKVVANVVTHSDADGYVKAPVGGHLHTVLLAHHQDDQAETVLLQLARGASLRGMAAMPVLRPLTPEVQLFRPLLAFSRQQLVAFAQANGLRWIEDESNLDTTFSRNRVRHRLMPQLANVMPDIAPALVNAAAQFSESAELLDALAKADAAGMSPTRGVPVQHICSLPEPRARNLLRFWLHERGGQVHRQSLIEAVRQLCNAPSDSRTRVDFSGVSVVCSQGKVYLVDPRYLSAPGSMSVLWQGESHLDLGVAGILHFVATKGAGIQLEPGATCIRFRQTGDRIRLSEKQAMRRLKDLLREAGIPHWQRAWLPMLEVKGGLAWVAEVGESADYQAGPDQPGWLISWQAPG